MSYVPTPEEALEAINRANKPERIAAARKAEQDCTEARKQFAQGLLSPLDYAEQCMLAWSDAEQTIRWRTGE